MLQRHRLAIAATCGTAVALLSASTALAAPTNAPGVEAFVVSCPGTFGDVTIVTPPGNGDYTPGFVVAGHQLLIPYQFTFTFSDGTPEGTGTESMAKKAPLPASAITCTFGDSFTDPETGQTLTFQGSVTGPVRGH